MRRRTFLKQSGAGALLLGLGALPLPALARSVKGPTRLCILHTNDLHGCFEGPQGRALQDVFEEQIRQARQAFDGNVLLFDSGDQLGTAQGESRQIEAMAALGYDAVALGNQDLKYGVPNLFKQYNYDKIQILSSNYCLKNTALEEKIAPFRIFEREGLRVGVFALNDYYNSMVFKYIDCNVSVHSPLETAHALAAKIADNAPLAVAAVKRLTTIGSELPLAAGLELEQHAFGVLRDSEDRIEGRKAFAEKRKPQFRGC